MVTFSRYLSISISTQEHVLNYKYQCTWPSACLDAQNLGSLLLNIEGSFVITWDVQYKSMCQYIDVNLTIVMPQH